MMATTMTWLYATQLANIPEGRYQIEGRNSFAFSDLRHISSPRPHCVMTLMPFAIKKKNSGENLSWMYYCGWLADQTMHDFSETSAINYIETFILSPIFQILRLILLLQKPTTLSLHLNLWCCLLGKNWLTEHGGNSFAGSSPKRLFLQVYIANASRNFRSAVNHLCRTIPAIPVVLVESSHNSQVNKPNLRKFMTGDSRL